MQFGIFSVGDVTADPTTGRTPTEHERIRAQVEIALKAEEVGLDVSPDAFGPLGPAVALSPGVLGERVHFLHALVDPTRAGVPGLDGSPVEERALIRFVPLSRALEAIREGRVADVKTEVAVRRLIELRGPK